VCGVSGFIDAGRRLRSEEMEDISGRMAVAIAHRGPDDFGTWMDEPTRVVFGHRRLAILDLSSEGHQPMVSSCGRYVLSSNNEIYNFRELRRALEREGRRFRGHSDTEVMVEAFSAWGLVRALTLFNGMFAFSLFDRTEKKLYLARDRMGEKPMYYGWAGPTFLFGSELKALRVHPDFSGRIDVGALALFLRHSHVPGPLSIYEGMRKLPPATYLEVDPRAIGTVGEPFAYWSLRDAIGHDAREASIPSEEAANALDELLGDAVQLRMEADVPLGAFLSGGVDSSTVVALMQAHSPRPVRTFTIGFRETQFDEAVHAKAVADHLGTDHTELYVTPQDAVDVIPKLPHIYGEPFSDSSQIPTFLLAELTRRHVTVSLSGDGGDELFAGYPRYEVADQVWRTVSRVPHPLKGPAAHVLRSLTTDKWARRSTSMTPILPRRLRRNPTRRLTMLADFLAAEDPEAIHHGLVSNWHDPAKVVLGASEPVTTLTDRDRWVDAPTLRERFMYLDAITYLPDDILVKVDRATMAVSLESRMPLLDHRVVEFLWRFPLNVRVRDGEKKWLLRRVLYRYVPKEMIERPKMGFNVPVDAWLRGQLRDWTESLLDPRRIRDEGFFEYEPIRKMWSQHLAGTHEWGYLLWDVLMFQAWLETTATDSVTGSIS
jgi:asparagine synthase (glutamine-hydrolysing)